MTKEIRHNTKGNNPFLTPTNYFNNLQSSILEKTVGEEKMKILPFTTPPDYFSRLEENIWEKTIQQNKKNKGKILPLFTKKIYWVSAAACILIAVTISVYVLNVNTSDTTKVFAHQNNNRAKNTVTKDKLYTDNTEKETVSFSSPEINNQEKNTFVSHNKKALRKIQNKKANLTTTNKEKRTSEIIYGLYFEDDFPELEEEYF